MTGSILSRPIIIGGPWPNARYEVGRSKTTGRLLLLLCGEPAGLLGWTVQAGLTTTRDYLPAGPSGKIHGFKICNCVESRVCYEQFS